MNKEIKSIIDGLTDKQKRFCYEYVLHLNGTKAAINAGYSEKTACVIASENLTKPNIKAVIDHMQNNLAETAELSALKILEEHKKMAFSSIGFMHDTWIERKDFDELSDAQKASIKSITTKILKKNIGTQQDPEIVDVEYVKIELYDKQKSLDAINTMLGYNQPIRIDQTSSVVINEIKSYKEEN